MQRPHLNVLISSVSKKVPLIQSVRRSLEQMNIPAKIIGGDSNSSCIGKYFTDDFWQMPNIDQLSPSQFIEYCHSHMINAIIPTRDGELYYYAENKVLFYDAGINVMISNPQSIQICLDKLLFYQTLEALGYLSIKTTTTLKDLNESSVVVKERFGAGGRNVGLNLSQDEADHYSKTLQNPIFQPFIEGDEISVDLYLDIAGNTKGVILRKREFVVDGESQITTTFRNEKLENVCDHLAQELGLYGHVMFQLIHCRKSGLYYFMESNPRFGGASRLSLEMGLDSFYWFFQESCGMDLTKNPFKRSTEEKRLIRYAEDLIVTCNTNV